jgi:hypothetical protein
LNLWSSCLSRLSDGIIDMPKHTSLLLLLSSRGTVVYFYSCFEEAIFLFEMPRTPGPFLKWFCVSFLHLVHVLFLTKSGLKTHFIPSLL